MKFKKDIESQLDGNPGYILGEESICLPLELLQS